MRVVSWNCNLSLGRKLERILALDPDIAVIQECEQNLQVPHGYFYKWCGHNPRKGLGVLTKNLESFVEPIWQKEWTYFLPLTIPSMNLKLLAIWAYNHRTSRFGNGFVGNARSVIDDVQSWLSNGPSLMVGDFNNSVIWDKPKGNFNFADINNKLNELGLVSAYHYLTGFGLGSEKIATFYHTKNVERPFHIDYCFVHQSIDISSLDILDFSSWREFSDHVPLVLDLKIDTVT